MFSDFDASHQPQDKMCRNPRILGTSSTRQRVPRHLRTSFPKWRIRVSIGHADSEPRMSYQMVSLADVGKEHRKSVGLTCM
jgi:hypothetical protein